MADKSGSDGSRIESSAKFARWVFVIAGVYGIAVLTPQYFLENTIGQAYPPPITHPEHFYGFIGVALAWQVVFLIIASDPARYRVMMVPAVLEKLAFGVACIVLYSADRIPIAVLAAGFIDLTLGAFFVWSYVTVRKGLAQT